MLYDDKNRGTDGCRLVPWTRKALYKFCLTPGFIIARKREAEGLGDTI